MAKSSLFVAATRPFACKRETTAGTWPGNVLIAGCWAAALERNIAVNAASPAPILKSLFLIRADSLSCTGLSGENRCPAIIGRVVNAAVNLAVERQCSGRRVIEFERDTVDSSSELTAARMRHEERVIL